MPRTLRPRLRTMLERANPNVATFVELSVPNASKVLRRAEDQFFSSPDPLVSMAPAASAVASQAGALTLASVASTMINQMADSGTYFYLPQEQGSETFHGTVGWQLASAFTGAVLRAVTVKLRWVAPTAPDVALQIYRVHRTAGVLQRQQGSSIVETAAVQHSFVPLLQQPIVRRFKDVGVLFSDVDVTFDLTPFRLEIQPISSPPPGPNESGDLPEYFFEVRPLQQGKGNFVGWVKDTTSARNINGLGAIREVGWQRKDPNDPASLWVRTDQNYSLCLKVDAEQYVPTSQAVYHIGLPSLPTSDSVGRVVFNHGAPSGTGVALELSTAGSSGPFTPVAHGDVVSAVQEDYHLRLTMTASADRQHAPVVTGLGVEFRSSVDLSPESTLEPMSQGVSVPFLQASVGEGSVSVVRTGRRDYRDVGAEVASGGPDTQLEIDAYIGSRHPAVTRDDWFHTTRASVSSRTPSGTSEYFSLLSLAKTLKRKIPARLESINTVHTVTAASTTQVQVTPVLLGASPTGNEYDAQGYYLRVRTSSQAGVETGQVFLIGGNTGVDTLDFPANADPTISKELPGTLAVGDEVEVHSGRYQQPAISWVDADPADVWLEILTVHLGVSEDRIGLADVGTAGRAGRPPKVTDRAPGDAPTQAKCKVTLKLTDAEEGDTLIDQLSFIVGGATVEIAGQIVFRQIYALYDADGRITVAPDAPVKTFDARDYVGLDTPTGREQRITVLACDYGVDTTSAEALPTATTNFVDVDALAEYGLQDVEGLGTDAVPDEIARWCYNSSDFGFFLASQLTRQVVTACSTGIRPWPFTAVDAHPELTVGDTVVLITDQYTDYDPARGAAIKGWAAYPLVLISTAGGGRSFVGFLQGLAGVVGVDVRGGEGTLQDNNPPPPSGSVALPPTASLDFVSEDDTEVVLALNGALGAGGTGPLEYSTRVDNGAWSAWSTAHADWTVPRLLKFTKTAQLQTRQADGQVSVIARYAVTGVFPQVDSGTGLVNGLDASGLVTHPVPLPVAVANIPAIDATDGHVNPGVTLHGTSHFIPRATDVNGMILDPGTEESQGKELRRLFAKPLFNSPNDLGSVADGSGWSKVNAGAIGASGYVDMGGSAWLNRHLGNIADDAGSDRRAATANEKTGGTRGFSGFTTTGGALVSTATEGAGGKEISRLYAKPLPTTPEDLGAIANGSGWGKVKATALDVNGNPSALGDVNVTSVYDATAGAYHRAVFVGTSAPADGSATSLPEGTVYYEVLS